MAIARKIALLAAILGLSFFAAGYATAWLRLEQCRSVTVQKILSHKVTGLDFGGERVALTAKDVTARISGPFKVQTQYMVPTGFHGNVHYQTFVTLPWGIKAERSRVDYLL